MLEDAHARPSDCIKAHKLRLLFLSHSSSHQIECDPATSPDSWLQGDGTRFPPASLSLLIPPPPSLSERSLDRTVNHYKKRSSLKYNQM